MTERISKKPGAREDDALDIADAPIPTPPRHRPGDGLRRDEIRVFKRLVKRMRENVAAATAQGGEV